MPCSQDKSIRYGLLRKPSHLCNSLPRLPKRKQRLRCTARSLGPLVHRCFLGLHRNRTVSPGKSALPVFEALFHSFLPNNPCAGPCARGLLPQVFSPHFLPSKTQLFPSTQRGFCLRVYYRSGKSPRPRARFSGWYPVPLSG